MAEDGTILDDLWSWDLTDPSKCDRFSIYHSQLNTLPLSDAIWRQDYTADELFASGSGGGEVLQYYNNSPTTTYVTPDSDLTMLQRFWIPTKPVAQGQ